MLYFLKSPYTDKFVLEAQKTFQEIQLIQHIDDFLDTRFNKLIVDEGHLKDILHLKLCHKVYVFQGKEAQEKNTIGLNRYQSVTHNLNLIKDEKNSLIFIVEKSEHMMRRILIDIDAVKQNVLYLQMDYTPDSDVNLFYLSGLDSAQKLIYLKGHLRLIKNLKCLFLFNHLKDALDPPMTLMNELLQLLLKEHTLVIGTSELKGTADAQCLELADRILCTDALIAKGLERCAPQKHILTINPIKYEKDIQNIINHL